MNTALKSPAPAANLKLYFDPDTGFWWFDCWGTLAQSQPQFCADDEGMSRRNPTGRDGSWSKVAVATEILIHNPLAVFAGDAREGGR